MITIYGCSTSTAVVDRCGCIRAGEVRGRPPRSIEGVWSTNAAAVAALDRVGAAAWCGYVDELLERVGRHVVRPESRTRLGAMVLALLSRQGPRNCWSLAEQAGEARPWGMQHLLVARGAGGRGPAVGDAAPAGPGGVGHRRGRRRAARLRRGPPRCCRRDSGR